FVEGFAEFYATASFGVDGSVTVGAIPQFRVQSLRSSGEVTGRDLLTTGALDLRDHALDQFYARSWLLVHYLTFNQGRTGQRARYIAAIERGASLEDAAREAFGDMRDFDGALRRYIDGPISTATVAARALPAPHIDVRPLTAPEIALVPLRIEQMRGVDPARIPAFSAEVRAIAAKYPGDPQALLMLAEAEGLAGNHAASSRAADTLLASVPAHPRALLRKAANLEALGQDRKAARPLIVRANRADQKDPLPLLAYYRSFRPEGAEPAPALALDGLLLAVQLAPQSGEVRLIAGAALAKAGRLEEAENILRPAAYAPHGGATAQKAEALLKLVEAGTPSPTLLAEAERALVETLDPA
ncbi:MAG TPA: hypothetical protein VK472_02635, partial [Allosphingosinicella sp.]|nr:hypothetical protein [Allosphingosinicella sp.]